MNLNSKKVHFRIKSKRKALTRYEKSDLKVNIIGHFLTILLVLLAFKEVREITNQYNFNINQFNLDNERQKKANTIAYLQTLHELLNNTDESLLEIIKYYDIENDSISMISCDSLEKILNENHTYREQLHNLYIGFNQFAIGCREGFFDEMTAWSANYTMVFNVAKALIPYYELIEKECGFPDNQFYGCFLRIMAFRWENDSTMGIKYNKMINQFWKETTKATNDSMPIIRRMPVDNE